MMLEALDLQIIESSQELSDQFNFIVLMTSKEVLLLIFMLTHLYNSNVILDPQYIEIDKTYKINWGMGAFLTYNEGSKSIFSLRQPGFLSYYQMNSSGFYNLISTFSVQSSCWGPHILVNDDESKIFLSCSGSGSTVGTLVNGVYTVNNNLMAFDQIEQISSDGQYVLWSNNSNYRMISKDMGNNNYVHYQIPNSNTQDSFCYIYDSNSLIIFWGNLQLQQYDLSTLFTGNPTFSNFTITGNLSSLLFRYSRNYYDFYSNTGKPIIVNAINSQYRQYILLLVFKNGNWEITQCIQPFRQNMGRNDKFVSSSHGNILLRINKENYYVYRYNPNTWIYQYQVTVKTMFSEANMVAVSEDGVIFVDNQFLYQITYTKSNSNNPNNNNGNSNGTGTGEHKIENNVTFQMDTSWVLVGFGICNIFLLTIIGLITKQICCKAKQQYNVGNNFNDPAERKEFLRKGDENSTVDNTKTKEFMSEERERYLTNLTKSFKQPGFGKSLFGEAEVVDLKELIN